MGTPLRQPGKHKHWEIGLKSVMPAPAVSFARGVDILFLARETRKRI